MLKSVRIFSVFLVNDARLGSNFKNSCFVFHRGFQTLENNKSTAFISFLVFGNPDETLALVFEILHQERLSRRCDILVLFVAPCTLVKIIAVQSG